MTREEFKLLEEIQRCLEDRVQPREGLARRVLPASIVAAAVMGGALIVAVPIWDLVQVARAAVQVEVLRVGHQLEVARQRSYQELFQQR